MNWLVLLSASLLVLATNGCGEDTSTYEPEVEEAPAPAPEPAPAPAPEPEPEPEPEPDDGLFACEWSELEPLLSCAFEACVIGDIDPANPPTDLGSIDTNELMTCALLNCSSDLLSIPTDCQQCLINGVSGGTDAILEECANGDLSGLGGGGGGGLPFP